jgi:hypothetical protein
LNQKIFYVQTVLTGDENIWIPDLSGILIEALTLIGNDDGVGHVK